MTLDQLTALEWALRHLSDHPDPAARRAHLPDLESLLFESKQNYFSFDRSASDVFSFMEKHGLTIPAAEVANWRMVLPHTESLGTLLTCPACGLVFRIGARNHVANSPALLPPAKRASVAVSERPTYCVCERDLSGVATTPIVGETPLVGAIVGLPESYGTLRATNGILCYIERSDGTLYGPAHLDHFLVDPKAVPTRINHDGTAKRTGVGAKTGPKKSSLALAFEELIA